MDIIETKPQAIKISQTKIIKIKQKQDNEEN